MTAATWRAACLAAGVWTMAGAAPAVAQVAISANDNKATLVDGVNTVVKNPAPDTVTLLDLSVSPPRVIAEVRAPNSVIGPPQNVAISPDGAIALVASSTKIDPADATKTIPDDAVSVIDLKAATPKVIATVHAGKGASGISFNPAGALALVANRIDGTLSVLTVHGTTVTNVGTVSFNAPDSGPSHVVFSHDGATALVTRNNDNLVSVLAVRGTNVTSKRQDLSLTKPYGIEVTPAGDAAVVGAISAGAAGGVDSLSVIDLTGAAPRVVSQIEAGPTVEGVSLSADGRFVAATVMDGSNLSRTSPFFHDAGQLRIFRLENRTLTPVTSAPTGHWCQGAGWSRDGQTVIVQCMADKMIRTYHFDGRTLTGGPSIVMDGGPAGLRVGR